MDTGEEALTSLKKISAALMVVIATRTTKTTTIFPRIPYRNTQCPLMCSTPVHVHSRIPKY